MMKTPHEPGLGPPVRRRPQHAHRRTSRSHPPRGLDRAPHARPAQRCACVVLLTYLPLGPRELWPLVPCVSFPHITCELAELRRASACPQWFLPSMTTELLNASCLDERGEGGTALRPPVPANGPSERLVQWTPHWRWSTSCTSKRMNDTADRCALRWPQQHGDQKNAGGPRLPPRYYVARGAWLEVAHTPRPTHILDSWQLWLWAANGTNVFFAPGRVFEVSDTVDLARWLGNTYAPPSQPPVPHALLRACH